MGHKAAQTREAVAEAVEFSSGDVLADIDPAATGDGTRVARGDRGGDGGAARRALRACRSGSTPRASAVATARCSCCCRDGHLRQGRHRAPGRRRHEPGRRAHPLVQEADLRGARARLPVARRQRDAGRRRGRGVQPVAVRGRPGRARARPRAEERVVDALRPHQRVRAPSGRRRHPPRQGDAPHLEGGAEAAARPSGWRTRPSTGSTTRATCRSARSGTTTRRRTRTPSPGAPPMPRRGTSCRPTSKWYRNWVVANLLVDALRDLDPQYPPAGFDLAEQRRLVAALD